MSFTPITQFVVCDLCRALVEDTDENRANHLTYTHGITTPTPEPAPRRKAHRG